MDHGCEGGNFKTLPKGGIVEDERMGEGNLSNEPWEDEVLEAWVKRWDEKDENNEAERKDLVQRLMQYTLSDKRMDGGSRQRGACRSLCVRAYG